MARKDWVRRRPDNVQRLENLEIVVPNSYIESLLIAYRPDGFQLTQARRSSRVIQPKPGAGKMGVARAKVLYP